MAPFGFSPVSYMRTFTNIQCQMSHGMMISMIQQFHFTKTTETDVPSSRRGDN